MKEPIRMGESGELPPTLRDAFGLLGRDGPSPDVTLRVQRALEALPAIAPSTAMVGTLGTLGTLGLGKLLLVTTLIAGVVTSAILVMSRPETPQRAPAMSAASAAPTPQATSVGSNSPALHARHELAVAPDPNTPSPQAGRGQEAPASLPPATQRSLSGASKAPPVPSVQGTRMLNASARAGAARTADGGRTRSQAGVPSAAVPTAVEATPDPSHEAQRTPAPPDPPVANAQANEAQRLALCKRLATRDPREALRQVEALAREVPNGLFVQERELLAIRLYEQLGQRATAEQLARRFRERYPDSVYRRALAP